MIGDVRGVRQPAPASTAGAAAGARRLDTGERLIYKMEVRRSRGVFRREEPCMGGKNDRFRPGDMVEETAEYVCDLCNTEGGTDTHHFHKGDKFGECMNCGRSTSWKKVPSR
jgi:hypothetical protein